MNRRDPRIQQTLNRFTNTLESANTATQTSIFDFNSHYIAPCLESLGNCLESSCAPCAGFVRDRARARQRAFRSGQRPEAVFDFYNTDWDDDPYEYGTTGTGGGGGAVGMGAGGANERTGLLSGWAGNEADRLLAGRTKVGAETQQPGRQRGMTYGTKAAKVAKGTGRRPSTTDRKGERGDPTLMPTSSRFGFLESLPWRIGGRGVRYKPSVADLREGLGRKPQVRDGEEHREEEAEALLEGSEGEGQHVPERGHRRVRSGTVGTVGSGHTDTSRSSRGDLLPSDEEDDAVMIDDEFAMALERRNTEEDPAEAGKMRASRPSHSRKSTSTKSRESRSLRTKHRTGSGDSLITSAQDMKDGLAERLPTMEDLRREEQQVRDEEDAVVERKRQEAQEIAIARGLIDDERDKLPSNDHEGKDHTQTRLPVEERRSPQALQPPEARTVTNSQLQKEN